MRANQNRLIGVGLYTVPEAAHLTKVPYQTVRRWVSGYKYVRDREAHERPPVWETENLAVDGAVALSFLDLMELRFVNAFRRFGVGLPTIRKAAERANDLFKQDHPFTRKRFQTDGRGIFAEIIEVTGKKKLLDIVRSQYAFDKVIRPSLYKSLVFSDDDEALFWHPMWPKRDIVVDPQRSFGRPIVMDGGVPTEVLAQAVVADGSAERVSRWYDVPLRSVRAAVKFERELAA